jgi:hypothetical protein
VYDQLERIIGSKFRLPISGKRIVIYSCGTEGSYGHFLQDNQRPGVRKGSALSSLGAGVSEVLFG